MNWMLPILDIARTGQTSTLGALMPFLLILPIFYFLLIRPQQKKQKQFQEMLAQIKKNDKVVTTGGIHGLIVGVAEQTVTLKVADNVRVELEKSSVARVLKPEVEAESKS